MPVLPSSYVPEILIDYADHYWVERLKEDAERAKKAFERRPTDIRREKLERAARAYQLAGGSGHLPRPTHPVHERYC